jgi:tRNA(His) 5'-end guanylyltransferase
MSTVLKYCGNALGIINSLVRSKSSAASHVNFTKHRCRVSTILVDQTGLQLIYTFCNELSNLFCKYSYVIFSEAVERSVSVICRA